MYYLVRSMHTMGTVLSSINIAAYVVTAGFRAHASALLEQAASATHDNGAETMTSRHVYEHQVLPALKQTYTAQSVARIIEASLLVFVASAFLLFFPACIVMFRRVQRKLETIFQEMNLRSDCGNAFLPFEFSTPAEDGSVTQVELPIVEARQFLGAMMSSAAAQRRRFMFCLGFVLTALIVLASFNAFLAYVFLLDASVNVDCGFCDPCQSVGYLMLEWWVGNPELEAYVLCLCSTLPMVLSLRLMTTAADRTLLLNPGKFLTDQIALHPIDSEQQHRINEERHRMGINLRATTY
jgi:hypothetical protein